ncbi:hypothetical protein L3X65_14885 [Vibrio diabolicus]|uniref:hypothetical protein n=1 Tax=Vibrio diabolicus TaxID=50719 RepID=UPI00211AC929|nr:hypothetical protein [Vibrio diabolicus]MCG9230451.1 hypothetical protein [Vibrio diabolicus]MCG9573065.1 hypothetical protein [Vibrio diabolicus]MCG9595055.1 hypothetical protein [Vibrio diabolicus]MCG9776458.1 hypothetical protein [Vibrio diabolicus]
MEYPIQLFGYLNEQDAEPMCMVPNITQDTVQELNRLLQSIKRKAKYGVTKLSSSMLIF